LSTDYGDTLHVAQFPLACVCAERALNAVSRLACMMRCRVAFRDGVGVRAINIR
jgi:hypothetical protein